VDSHEQRLRLIEITLLVLAITKCNFFYIKCLLFYLFFLDQGRFVIDVINIYKGNRP